MVVPDDLPEVGTGTGSTKKEFSLFKSLSVSLLKSYPLVIIFEKQRTTRFQDIVSGHRRYPLDGLR